MIYSIAIIILLVLLAGVLTATEVSLVVISDNKVDDAAKSGNKRAIRIKKFNLDPRYYLSTIQVTTTLITLAIGAITVEFHSNYYVQFFPLAPNYIRVFAALILIIILLLVYFVAGRVVPKRLGNKYAETIAYSTINFVMVLKMVTMPLIFLLRHISNFIGGFFGLEQNEDDRKMTEEEILDILNESSKTGNINEEEREMIENIFDFNDTIVEDIMTHRTEISALNINSTKDQVIKYIDEERFTRFPVYKDNIDHIEGTIHVKDLLKYAVNLEEPFSLKSILREPFFIPDSKNNSELFKEMQAEKKHLAIVLDEYGGTAGIVTIEDLIEEILGDIFDEYDEVEEEIMMIEKDIYEIEGLCSIHDVEDVIKAGLPIEEYDTLSGFILGQLGRLPHEKEDVIIDFNNYRYEVLNIDDKIISRVRVMKIKEENMIDEDE